MPMICRQCGKEHATLEELEALANGGLIEHPDDLRLGEENRIMRKVTKKLRRSGNPVDSE